MTTRLPDSARLHYLDAVRGFALILGIVFHASLSFVPFFIGWAVMDISTSQAVSVFVLISHSFRMELFFLIAGYFSRMAFHQKGARSFIYSRATRIGLPFVVGWFLLRPMLVAGWVAGAQSMRGEVQVWAAMMQGIGTLAELPASLWVGTHLWFLYYLLLISALVMVCRGLVGRVAVLKAHLPQWADVIVRRVCQSGPGFLLCSIPLALCLWWMESWGMDTPDKSLFPHVPVLLVYGGFFVLGWLLHRQPSALEQFVTLSGFKCLTCVFAIITSVSLSAYGTQTGHPLFLWFKAGFVLSYAVMMWTLVSIAMGLCKKCFARPGIVIRYLSDASYWLYLVHLPIVIGLQIVFAELPFHWSAKLVSIVVLTLALSLMFYEAGVRWSFVGQILNGKRQSSWLVRKRVSGAA